MGCFACIPGIAHFNWEKEREVPDNTFSGVFTVVPTPLDKNENLDQSGLDHLIEFYIDSGCHGLLILGSGGEFPYFSYREKARIVETAITATKGRVPLLVGVGFHGSSESLEFIREIGEKKIDGLLVITPTFYPLIFSDVYSFYVSVCQQSKKPVLFYNYPQNTGLYFSTREVVSFLSIEGMAGIKDTILNFNEIEKHIKLTRHRDIAVFSGNSLVLKKVIEMGGKGVIAVIPSVAPKLVVSCYNACLDGNHKEAEQLQDKILNLIPLLNSLTMSRSLQKHLFKVVSSLPVPMKKRSASRAAVVKETLRQLGHPIRSRVKSPQPQIRDNEKEAIRLLLNQYDYLK